MEPAFFQLPGFTALHDGCLQAALGFGFWLSRQVVGEAAEDGMGQFGKITAIGDLPSRKVLAAYLNKAVALNEAGVKLTRPKAGTKPAPALPDDLAALLALKKHAAGRKTTKVSAPVPSANTSTGSTTRKPMSPARSALPHTVTWLGEGKVRNWKYLKHAERHPPMIRARPRRRRRGHPRDLCAPVIAGVATFETSLPGVARMRERLTSRMAHYPWLVWEEHGEILAYAYAGRFRERAAYDWIAETSIYVDGRAHRRGIAQRLYAALLEIMRQQGINQAVGVITLPGTVSVAMHEAMGFAAAGVWKQCGYKLDRWWDVGVWQKQLQPMACKPSANHTVRAITHSRVVAVLLK